MDKAISYSLFGYGQDKPDNCFTFDSYLVGLMLSVRMNKLLFPDWVTVVQLDPQTHGAYSQFFDKLVEREILEIGVSEHKAPLCEAMLWRMKPIFWKNSENKPRYSHVLCRDLDSLHTYREAQAVQQWVNGNKGAHAITDSISHTIPMLGGMIGFRPDIFTERVSVSSYDEMIKLNTYDMNKKGADQHFLNRYVYPKFSQMGNDSITQHYFKGHGNSWLSDFYTCSCWISSCRKGHDSDCKLNIDLELPEELKETEEVSEHMGAAGYNSIQTMNIVNKYRERFADIEEIEREYPNIFYWNK